jgi:phospholipid transport system substrate-binding protein
MSHFRSPVLKTIAAAVFLVLASVPAKAGASTPEATVDAFHGDLISVMKESKQLGISGRYDKFLKQLDRYFHMPLMVSFVSGEHWAKADQGARIKLNQAARRMGAGELAVLFSGYGGEVFKTLGTRTIKDGSVLVETALVRTSDSDVKVLYRLRQFGENWRIIDVLLDGAISQLLKRRDEYRRTLETSGISGLTDLLNAKADEILSTAETEKAAN